MDIITQSDIEGVLEDLIIEHFSLIISENIIESLAARLLHIWDTVSPEQLQPILEKELACELDLADVISFNESLYNTFI